MGRLGYLLREARAAYGRVEDARRLHESFPGTSFGENVRVVSPELLELGSNILVQHDTVLHCGGLNWSDGRGRIVIGSHSVISARSMLWGAGEIELGEGFECGPGTLIFSSAQDFEARLPKPITPPLSFAKVTAGRFVSVFSGAIVGPGVTLGDGAVIGGGSVVTCDVPARQFWGGVPARPIRELPPWDSAPADLG